MNCLRGVGSEMALTIFPEEACTKQDLTLPIDRSRWELRYVSPFCTPKALIP